MNENLECVAVLQDILDECIWTDDEASALTAAIDLMQRQGEAVAFALANETGEIGAMGWMDMKFHDQLRKFATLSEGWRIVYAYALPPTPAEVK